MVDPGEGTSWVSKKCEQIYGKSKKIWKMMRKQQGEKLGNHGKNEKKTRRSKGLTKLTFPGPTDHYDPGGPWPVLLAFLRVELWRAHNRSLLSLVQICI